jgi:hypothetical protein
VEKTGIKPPVFFSFKGGYMEELSEVSPEIKDKINNILENSPKYTEEMIQEKIEKKKPHRSLILEEERIWKFVELSQFPEPGKLVVIRIAHKTEVDEFDEYISQVEDVKIGSYHPEEGWKVAPPHPVFDFSSLSKEDKIIDDAEVTHWALPEEGEVERWEKRWNPSDLYKTINFTASSNEVEKIFIALHYALGYMRAQGYQYYPEGLPAELKVLIQSVEDVQLSLKVKDE